MSKRVLALVLAALFPGAALAQAPSLVKDINTSTAGGTAQWSFSTRFVEMGGVLYFSSSDGIHGTELWRTDGTAAGTRMVKDICPGSCGSGLFSMTAWGSSLYFSARDGAHGSELWKSDGTEAGTVLVKDLNPGLEGSFPLELFELRGGLYFTAYQDATGWKLWKTDGTEAGTVLFADLSYPLPLGRIGTTVFLSASDPAHGRELWAFDGSRAGPVLVKDINPGTESSVYSGSGIRPGYRSTLVVGNRLYFTAQDGTSGIELWATDGTAAGTVLVKDINPGPEGSQPFSLGELNGAILFRACDGTQGCELWKSDGTPAGTTLVKDIWPGPYDASPTELTVLGSWVYFQAFDNVHGAELWRSDGTEANTTLVKDIRPGPASGLSSFLFLNPAGFAAVGTVLTFFADDGTNGLEPWKSDGTEAGTTLLADLNPGAGSSTTPRSDGPITDIRAVWGGRWYFRAGDADWEIEVYASDGTPAGTQRLAEINTQTSAFDVQHMGPLFNTGNMTDANGTLFFQASDGLSGTELWKSDGTGSGTEQVADLFPGATGSEPFEITPLGGSVLFNAMPPRIFDFGYRKLCISDGTGAGTAVVKHDLAPTEIYSEGYPEGLTPFGGQVFFTSDYILWKSDGTEAGTVPVLPEEDWPMVSSPAELTPVGSLLFYSGIGPGGYELWRTDGTEAGTVQVADIAPGASSSHPARLTRVGSRLFFSADDGSSGRELWASDGVNTWRVKDILPGSGSGIDSYVFKSRATARGKLFFPADDGSTGQELWVSDGTEAGTFRLQDIFSGPRSSEIQLLTSAGDRLYFVADDGIHGRELWVSNGTYQGTRLLIDLVPGPGSSLPEQLREVGRNLVFSAWTPEHGREPWVTDGYSDGTRRFGDIAPGPLPSSPILFTPSGPWLYFAATDAETGFELYSVPRFSVDGGGDFHTVPPCRVVDTRLEGGPLLGAWQRSFDVAGLCGIPETAKAIAANVTAVADTHGFLFVHRAGGERPESPVLFFSAGKNRSNNAMIQLGSGAFTAMVGDGSQSHLVVDVSGYYE